MEPMYIMEPARSSVCAVLGKRSKKIGFANTARPTAHGKETTITKRIAILISWRTAFISPFPKDAVSVGTDDAAIAEAMEIGTLIKSLYFPV